MPLYEYLCNACGHRFERIQKYSDPIADTCPVCGGSVQKLFSSPAFQFKGSGFYATDYASKDRGGPPAGSDEGPKAAEGKDKADKDKGEKKAAASDSAASDASSSSSSDSSSSASSSSSSPSGSSSAGSSSSSSDSTKKPS